jgi:hypothetical protein
VTNHLDEEIKLFQRLIDENRYDFLKLAYIIFPFGEKGGPLEDYDLYDWQKEELIKLSNHLKNPMTRYELYRLVISSGNGAAKTAFGSIVLMCLLYTQRLKARITANTDPQMKSIIWPEYDLWFNRARYVEHFFEKFGTSIKAKNPKLSETWRIDTVTWSEQSPASISGLHNKGGAVAYVFEEAPGIPAVIWQYASGAFTETGTIKLFLAFGNSDDPESKFEQNMASPLWNSRRIDTRTLKHIDPKQIQDWLIEAGGDEENDDFRVRVRGLPRKSAKDSIIKIETVEAALARRIDFDKQQVAHFPVILGCDPAWTGGDETTIWMKQGHYRCMLEKFKLQKKTNDTHRITYNKLCYWERKLKADAVHIDQAEGTAVYTLAMDAQKHHWVLVAFGSNPSDNPDSSKSEYKNIRAMMYYKTQDALMAGGVLDAMDPAWIEDIKKQLCWAKGTRHKITHQKLVESKKDIKDRVGRSPDVADGCVLLEAYEVIDKLAENELDENGAPNLLGSQPLKMAAYDADEIYSEFEYDESLYD